MDKGLVNIKSLKEKRRELRNHATVAKIVLWNELNNRQLLGYKFRRQHSIGPYIVDFYNTKTKLAIELDGALHEDAIVKMNDIHRDNYLNEMGVKILRFENREVLENCEDVIISIKNELVNIGC